MRISLIKKCIGPIQVKDWGGFLAKRYFFIKAKMRRDMVVLHKAANYAL